MEASHVAFGLLTLGAAGVRLGELIVSARRARGDARVRVPEPGLFPLMVLLHTAFLVAPAIEIWAFERPLLLWLALPCGVGLLLATALRAWVFCSLGRAWTVHVVAPSEDSVVTSGPYRFVRHPNYLVVILELLCLPLLHSAWISALCLSLVNAGVLWRRIRTEEAALQRVASWRTAMLTRKRLVPGLL
jgi:methyltransferase